MARTARAVIPFFTRSACFRFDRLSKHRTVFTNWARLSARRPGTVVSLLTYYASFKACRISIFSFIALNTRRKIVLLSKIIVCPVRTRVMARTARAVIPFFTRSACFRFVRLSKHSTVFTGPTHQTTLIGIALACHFTISTNWACLSVRRPGTVVSLLTDYASV